MSGKMRVFSGSANPALAKSVCDILRRDGAIDAQSGLTTSKFADGEIAVQLGDNVRHANCYVVQPTCAPTNDNLMELLNTVDALKRASADEIVAVMPYFGYARQDRKDKPRRPISAKLVADMIQAAGVDRVVTVDLHAAAIQGFFNIPVDNLYARPALLAYVEKNLDTDNVVVFSPDVGGVVRARDWAERLRSTMGFIDKRRPRPNVSEIMHLVGDFEGKDVLFVDDMIDTAGTLCKAAEEVMSRGANSVRGCATHGVFSSDALAKIRDSKLVEVIVTDTVPLPDFKGDAFLAKTRLEKIKVVSLAPMLASALDRIHNGRSVSQLFD